jgi:hypothetical protein
VHFGAHYRSTQRNVKNGLAAMWCFKYGTHWHNAAHTIETTMQMTNATHTFLAEAARAASLIPASAPVNGERLTDDAPALAGRYAS